MPNLKNQFVEVRGLAENTLNQLDVRGFSLIEAFNKILSNNVFDLNESLDKHQNKDTNPFTPSIDYTDQFNDFAQAKIIGQAIYEKATSNYPNNPDIAWQVYFEFANTVKSTNLYHRWTETGKDRILVDGDVYRKNAKLIGNTVITETPQYIPGNDYQKKIDSVESDDKGLSRDYIDSAASLGTILGQLSTVPAGKITQDYYKALIKRIDQNYKNGLIPENIYRIELSRLVANINAANNSTEMSNTPHYNPGFSRPPDPTLRKIPLEVILEQNLLLPTDYQSSSFSYIMDVLTNRAGSNDAENLFRNTYLNNKAGIGNGNNYVNRRFNDGIMAGVAIRDIQEPHTDINGRTTKAFSFADDIKYLHPDRQDRGFINNIDVTQDKLLPAVIHSDTKSLFKNANLIEAIGGIEGFFKLADLGITADELEHFGFVENQYFPFLFETENRDGDDFKQYCFFQAALQSIQESYNPNWSSKTFYGRTEPIYTYTNTERTLDLRFIIFASSMRELQNIYERTNWLAQQTYGSFDNTRNPSRIKTGPLIRITVGDQFQRIPGFIRNLSFNWDHSGKWELTRGLRMLQTVEVSFSYQVIHQSLPDRNTDFYWGLEEGIHNNNSKLIPLNTRSIVGTPSEDFTDLLKRWEHGG